MVIDKKERVFIADRCHHRIQCINSQGKFLFNFGSKGKGNGEFDHPHDVTFDSKNKRLLVADTKNHRIQAFDAQGRFLCTFDCEGKGSRPFHFPIAITADQAGNFYVSNRNGHYVLSFDENGQPLTKYRLSENGQGGPKKPHGIGILSNGDIVIAEWGNQTLSVFNPEGQIVRQIGKGKLNYPLWLFVDSQDNILVAKSGAGDACIWVFSREGKRIKKIGEGLFCRVHAVVVNRKGQIFASGSAKDGCHCVLIF